MLPAAIAYRPEPPAEAQAICGQVLAAVPDHFDALHLLGVSALDGGRLEQADRRSACDRRRTAHTRRSPISASRCSTAKRYEEARMPGACDRAEAEFLPALTGLGNTLMNLRLSKRRWRS